MKPGTDNKKLQVFPVNGIAGVVSTLCPCKRHEAPASKPKAQAVSSSPLMLWNAQETGNALMIFFSKSADKI